MEEDERGQSSAAEGLRAENDRITGDEAGQLDRMQTQQLAAAVPVRYPSQVDIGENEREHLVISALEQPPESITPTADTFGETDKSGDQTMMQGMMPGEATGDEEVRGQAGAIESPAGPRVEDRERLLGVTSDQGDMHDGLEDEENESNVDSVLGVAPTAPAYIHLSASVLSFPVRKRVYIDESSQTLLIVSSGEVRAMSLRAFVNAATGKHVKPGDVFARFAFREKCGIMLVSPCCRYVAIQKSQTQVLVLALGTNLESTIECKSSDAIVTNGLVWVPSSMQVPPAAPCLCIVTSSSLTTYTLKPSSSNFSWMYSDYVNRTKYHWNLPSCSLICTATDDGEFHPYMLQKDSPYPERWAKFSMEQSRFAHGEAALAELYGDPWLLRMRPREILLYRLTRFGTSLTRTVQTPDGFALGISVLDSLLLVHSPSTRVSLLYDVRDETSDHPFTHPLPLGIPRELDDDMDSASTVVVPYSSAWAFLPPSWVFDARLGKIWQLELDLKAAADSCARSISDDPEPLARFLLRRKAYETEAKAVLFERMVDAFHDESDLAIQSQYLKVLAETTLPSSSLIPVLPDEVCTRFLDRLLVKPENPASPSLCASIALEYAKHLFLVQQQPSKLARAPGGGKSSSSSDASQVQQQLAMIESTGSLFARIATWLVSANRFSELYQIHLHRIATESSGFIQALGNGGQVSGSSISLDRVQAGLDCVKRLDSPRQTFDALIEHPTAYVLALKFAVASGLVKTDDEVVVLLFQRAISPGRSSDLIGRIGLLHNVLIDHRPELLDASFGSEDSTNRNKFFELVKEVRPSQSFNDTGVPLDADSNMLRGIFCPVKISST